MKVSLIRNSCLAALIPFLPFIQCAGNLLQARDYSDDSREFHQIRQLLENIRSLIGVPLSGVSGITFNSPVYLEVKPQDLVLLPPDYPPPNLRGTITSNTMMMLDEDSIVVICQDLDVASPFEWPLMRICPGQEKVLKDFILDLKSRGARIGVPHGRLEKAPTLEFNKFQCMPNDSSQTCSQPPPALPTTATSTWINLSEYLKTVYRPTASQRQWLKTSAAMTTSTNRFTALSSTSAHINSPKISKSVQTKKAKNEKTTTSSTHSSSADPVISSTTSVTQTITPLLTKSTSASTKTASISVPSTLSSVEIEAAMEAPLRRLSTSATSAISVSQTSSASNLSETSSSLTSTIDTKSESSAETTLPTSTTSTQKAGIALFNSTSVGVNVTSLLEALSSVASLTKFESFLASQFTGLPTSSNGTTSRAWAAPSGLTEYRLITSTLRAGTTRTSSQSASSALRALPAPMALSTSRFNSSSRRFNATGTLKRALCKRSRPLRVRVSV